MRQLAQGRTFLSLGIAAVLCLGAQIAEAGQPVKLKRYDAVAAQQWEILRIGTGNMFKIRSVGVDFKVLDFDFKSADVTLETDQENKYQKWTFVDIGNGEWLIRNVHTGYVLDYRNEGSRSGYVYLEEQKGERGNKYQRWQLSTVNGKRVIINVFSGLVLGAY